MRNRYSRFRHGSDLQGMDAQDHDERERSKNNICSLEWIAWAMDAARRHKETERLADRSQDRRVELESD